MITAFDSNYGIGKDNKLPWRNPSELKHFKELTKNSSLIVGRKTFDTLPPLENNGRKLFVVSKSGLSIEKAIDKANEHSKDIWVIGGAEIYRLAMIYCKELHISIIDGIYDCDTFFPKEDLHNFYTSKMEIKEGFIYMILKRNFHIPLSIY